MSPSIFTDNLRGLPFDKISGITLPGTGRGVRIFLSKKQIEVDLVPVRGGYKSVVQIENLPSETQVAYLQRACAVKEEDGPDADLWSAFVRKSPKVRQRAEHDLAALLSFIEKTQGGLTTEKAMREVCTETSISRPPLCRIRAKVRDVSRANWLPVLAADYKGGGKKVAVSEEAWTFFLSFLKQSNGRMPLTRAYRKTAELAEVFEWAWPTYGTIRNRWDALSSGEKALIRSGVKALDKTIPPMKRMVSHLQAMQIVNLDGRKADFFVRWEDGTVNRPIVIAIQDVYSRMIVGYRFSKTEDSDTTKAVILDVIDRYGLFDELRTDNGRAFASKKVSGGAPHRFRGKRGYQDELGILPLMGIKVGFAKPGRGQSKPIERGFRDLAEQVDTLPEFKGAYCGHKPDARPEDFTGEAVAIETARTVYEREIREHNERSGRRTEVCKGKLSFAQAFEESYVRRPARHLTQAQRQYFSYDMAYLKPHKETGALSKGGFTWWSAEHQDALLKHRNAKVCVLFDPADRSRPVIVQDMEGNLIAEALPCLARGRFDSTEDARQHERGKAQIKKAAQQELAGRKLMTAAQLANIQKRAELKAKKKHKPPVASETNVTKPLFGAPGKKARPAPTGPATVEQLKTQSDFELNVERGLEKLKAARSA